MKKLLIVIISFWPFIAYGAADLQLRSIRAVMETDNKTMDLQVAISNQGPNDASHIACNIYVYAEQKLVISQNANISPLLANASRKETFSVDLPAQAVTTVKVEIFDTEQPDTQPSNNSSQVNIKPPDVRTADLQIVDAAVQGEQPLRERGVSLRVRLRNNGPDSIGQTRLQADIMVFNSSVAKADKKIGKLTSGEEFELNMPLMLPRTIASSQGTIVVKWNAPEDEILDSAPENNELDIPVGLALRLPDLLPKDITLDQTGVLTFTIVNKGNSFAERSIAALYINGALIQRYKVPELRAGEDKKFQYTPDSPLPNGALVTVVADFNADVDEGSEENNRLTYQVQQ